MQLCDPSKLRDDQTLTNAITEAGWFFRLNISDPENADTIPNRNSVYIQVSYGNQSIFRPPITCNSLPLV